ncbi:putative replication factor C subunit 4 [Besnoitia besnoiti]|uniref:Putative replication factor C subunit 4 n=1 Tax=Besnoitia besnoiti TaxID=94643 RepID=A0A2A9M9L8_BESBE|nr:putative replication factor C subunit 4 [Besnoitia besnoiti]PFH32307.1 putative replication factor C subunit 4 [Besnoitia besnoiti]
MEAEMSSSVRAERESARPSQGEKQDATSLDSIWIEKYRPETLDDVVGNDQVMRRLRIIAQEGNMPHLMLAGPPGTGKTSSVLCLCKQLLANRWRTCTLELNASDERTIDVIREKVKHFAKEKRDLPPGRHKIVILDEVDSMTEAAQQALRRIMEQYSDTTRFALACNSSASVIEPLQSRCAILRFRKLDDAQLVRRLRQVCAMENVQVTDDGMEAVVFSADGDMRSALNNLQSTVSAFGTVNRENVEKVCDSPPPEAVRSMLLQCLAGKWREAHDVAAELLQRGYTPMDVVLTTRAVLSRFDSECKEHILLEYLKYVGLAHMTMASGLSTPLQLDKMLANLCRVSLVLPA